MVFFEADARRRYGKALSSVTLAVMVSIGFDCAITLPDAAEAAAMSTLTIARGGATPIVLRAPSNARCELGASNAPSGKKVTAISDAIGNVRYVVTVNSGAVGGVIATLECTSSKAHTLVGLTLLPGPPAPHPAATTTVHPPGIADLSTTARFGALPGTPAGFDVTTASDVRLAQLHYPPRPDSRGNSEAYAIWRKLATTPGMYRPIVPVPLSADSAGLAVSNTPLGIARNSPGRLKPTAARIGAPTLNQCGSLVVEVISPFWEIAGSWNVPPVFGLIGTISTSSTLIAFNGVSEGTEQDAINIPSFGSFGSYYSWYQVLNNRYGFNMGIGPGDVMGAYFYLTAQDGTNYSITMTDETNNTGGSVDAGPPPSFGSGSYSAEWLEERPQTQLPLPYFNPVFIEGTAESLDYHIYFVDGTSTPGYVGQANNPNGYLTLLQMTDTGSWSGDTMCSSQIVPGNVAPSVGLYFENPV